MDLKVTELQQPGKISFNYEELKTELAARVRHYERIAYTGDQIKQARSDRAALNKLKKALNDERIRQEREFMAPFEEFKGQVKELCGIIDKAAGAVDAQIKDYEEKQKAEKLEAIRTMFGELAFPVSLEKVMDQKWLNASISLADIRQRLEERKQLIMNDMAVIDELPAYAFEARHVYLDTLSLGNALKEAQRLQKQAEEKEAWEEEQRKRRAEAYAAREAERRMRELNPRKPETVKPEPDDSCVSSEEAKEVCRGWIAFDAYLSKDEAAALGRFLQDNNIKYRKHQEA